MGVCGEFRQRVALKLRCNVEFVIHEFVSIIGLTSHRVCPCGSVWILSRRDIAIAVSSSRSGLRERNKREHLHKFCLKLTGKVIAELFFSLLVYLLDD